MLDFILKTRGMRHVNRFCQNPTIKPTNIAEHSYFVVLYVKLILEHLDCFDDTLKYHILSYVMFHDTHEGISIDIPHNVKRKVNPSDIEAEAFEELCYDYGSPYVGCDPIIDNHWDIVRPLLKTADVLDVFLYCVEEVRMGNEFYKAILYEVVDPMLNYAKSVDSAVGCFRKEETNKVSPLIVDLIQACGYSIYSGVQGSKSMTHIHTGMRNLYGSK